MPLSDEVASMDSVLTNVLYISLSNFMKEDTVNTRNLVTSLTNRLLAMQPHEYDMEEYIQWNMKVEGWCDNLKGLVSELQSLQMIVAKQRINTPDSELEIDG